MIESKTKVVIEGKTKGVPFEDLAIGDGFECQGRYYIKTRSTDDANNVLEIKEGAISHAYCGPSYPVRHIPVTITFHE